MIQLLGPSRLVGDIIMVVLKVDDKEEERSNAYRKSDKYNQGCFN